MWKKEREKEKRSRKEFIYPRKEIATPDSQRVRVCVDKYI